MDRPTSGHPSRIRWRQISSVLAAVLFLAIAGTVAAAPGSQEDPAADPLMRSFRRVSEGTAHEAAGDLEAALAAYRKAADPPELFWQPPVSLEIPRRF